MDGKFSALKFSDRHLTPLAASGDGKIPEGFCVC